MEFDFSGKSIHFMRFVVNGEELDLDAFKTQEEFTRFEQEVNEFGEQYSHVALFEGEEVTKQ